MPETHLPKVLSARFPMTIFACLAAGVLVRLAFPPFSLVFFSIPGFALLFHVLSRTRHPFWCGLAFHGAWAGSLSLFLWEALTRHFGLGVLQSLGFYLAFATIAPSLIFALASLGLAWFARHARRGFRAGAGGAALLAAGVVLAQWARTSLTFEKGWGNLASTAYDTPWLLAWAPYSGGAGITFGLVLVASLAWLCVLAVGEKEFQRGAALGGLALAVTAAGFLGGQALGQSRADMEKGPSIRAALVHPAIDQDRRWKPQYHEENLETYGQMSQQAFVSAPPGGTRLIVWPETALTFGLETSEQARQMVGRVTRTEQSWLLLGVPIQEGRGVQRSYYNGAVLVSPRGQRAGQYEKMNLLPFAEKRIGFLQVGGGDHPWYQAGEKRRVLALKTAGGQAVGVGVAICFEVGMDSHVRGLARQGARLLVNLSNDAWFGESSESMQQMALLSLACAQYGMAGIRSTGYGRAGLVDFSGRVLKISDIQSPAVLVGDLDVPQKIKTWPTRFFRWFELLCMALVAGGVIYRIFFGSNQKTG